MHVGSLHKLLSLGPSLINVWHLIYKMCLYISIIIGVGEWKWKKNECKIINLFFVLLCLLSIKVWWLLLHFSESYSIRRIAFKHFPCPSRAVTLACLHSCSVCGLCASQTVMYIVFPGDVCPCLLPIVPGCNTFPHLLSAYLILIFLSRESVESLPNLLHIS